jgi:hypothetical protein
MHSFGRVIRRHENEALLQQPSAWHHNLYTDRSSAELLGEGRARTTRSAFGRSSQARTRRSTLTTRRYDAADSVWDSSTRHLFPSSFSCDLRGADTRSVAASSIGTSHILSPVHKVESFTGAHVILPTVHLTPGVSCFPSSGHVHDSPSSHRNDSPQNTGENIFRQTYDHSLPSLPPRIDSQDDPHSFQTSSPIVT